MAPIILADSFFLFKLCYGTSCDCDVSGLFEDNAVTGGGQEGGARSLTVNRAYRGNSDKTAAGVVTESPEGRCTQCHAQKKFCTCNVRRSTTDMAGQKRKPKQDPTSRKPKCVQVTSTGPCPKTSVSGTSLCDLHTCAHQGCKLSKSSKAQFCKTHARIADEYLDIIGSNA